MSGPKQPRQRRRVHDKPAEERGATAQPTATGPEVKLTTRQKRVLVLLMELGSAGPTAIGKELGIAPATAFRDRFTAEDGVDRLARRGKRALTEDGANLLDTLF